MKVSAVATFSLAVLLAAVIAGEEAVTPCPTTTTPHYDNELGCWAISVEHDATYCIDGPICSGSGATPAGTLCPVKSDVAIADCHSYLESYTGERSCVLPVDATCQIIKTGAWGCVLSWPTTPAPTKTCDGECNETTSTPLPTTTTTLNPTSANTPNPTATVKPCPTCTEAPTKAPTPTGTSTPPHTPTPTPTQCTGNCTHSGSGSGSEYVGNITLKAETTTESSSSSGVSAGVIGAIAAAAAVVAVIAAAAIYKQYTKKLDEEEARMNYRVDVVTP